MDRNVLESIKHRRSIRNYDSRAVSKDDLRTIIEAARWAPSAHNLQPWRFVATTNSVLIRETAGILDIKATELLSGFNIVMRETAKKMLSAKALIFVYSDNAVLKKFEKFDEPYAGCGFILETQSVACAVMNILLCADSLGIGAAWLGIAIFCEKEINALLNKNHRLVSVVSLGYPSGTSELKTTRKTISEILEIKE